MNSDRRLIEDYLPIEAISAEGAREKSVRKGHPSTLHLWWARRPLVACRAAVYATLVPSPDAGSAAASETAKARLRAETAAFMEMLCRFPGARPAIEEAQRQIWDAHAARLTMESGTDVTGDDVASGRAPRPRVLDMFAGGGAIPLEALRLGCDAYALELNPVAHITELCTLVYPERFGKPDSAVVGSGEGHTWAGLELEVKHWGRWVLDAVLGEIGDLYPPIPDPVSPLVRERLATPQLEMAGDDFRRAGQQEFAHETGGAHMTPIAYLWTRTVRCKNPTCIATVPLVRQTWLCSKPGRYVALRMNAPTGAKRVTFTVVEAARAADLDFDPAAFSKGGNSVCPFCGTVADAEYIKAEGKVDRIGQQLMAVAAMRKGRQGKVYLSADEVPDSAPATESLLARIRSLCAETGLSVPDEPLPARGTLGFRIQPYGFTTWGDLFTPRQMLALLSFAAAIRRAEPAMRVAGYSDQRVVAVMTFLAAVLDRLVDFNSSLCVFHQTGGRGIVHTFGRQALPMVWDFAETNPFNPDAASWASSLEDVPSSFPVLPSERTAVVERGTATALPWADAFFDAVITDPPYYDNVPYADISDFFYVWLKRTIGHLYPEHFAALGTPKKAEAVAEPTRFGGNRDQARRFYEQAMAEALLEANRVLKPGGAIVVVYAHKTTLGWATLVDALRSAGFVVTEAWPLDTEQTVRLRAQGSAALASSIFLVARKRPTEATGEYESTVRPQLESIVRERVETLWSMGISGADLVIAAIGAGLRAFTQFGRVEFSNGDPVPAERFLAEVEGVVLDTLLEKIFGLVGSSVSTIDGPSRFYVLWRFTYGAAELDAGEAIVFTYSQPVELDGPQGLTAGNRPLVRKNQGKYCLEDFAERGSAERLGEADRLGRPAPLIDVLHRVLWLMEHQPRSLARYLDETRPDPESLRILAQALAGAGLKGRTDAETRTPIATTPAEQSALAKLTPNWRSLIEQQLPTAYGPLFAPRP